MCYYSDISFHRRVKNKNIEALVETLFAIIKMNPLDYKIIFVESFLFNYNGISKILLMTPLLFPVFILGVHLWLMFLGARGVDAALETGDAKVSPLIFSDFQTSERREKYPKYSNSECIVHLQAFWWWL